MNSKWQINVSLCDEIAIQVIRMLHSSLTGIIVLVRGCGYQLEILCRNFRICRYKIIEIRQFPRSIHVDIPEALADAIEKAKTPAEIEKAGAAWCIEQSRELKAAGVPCLHYYTMGKVEVMRGIIKEVF